MQAIPADLPGGTGVEGSLQVWQSSNSSGLASGTYTGPIHLPMQNSHMGSQQPTGHQPLVQQLLVPGARNTCQDGQGARMDISSLNAFSERNAFNGFNQAEYDRSDWAPRVRPAPQMTPQATVGPFSKQQLGQQDFRQSGMMSKDSAQTVKQGSLLSQQSMYDQWHPQQFTVEQRDPRSVQFGRSMPQCGPVSELMDLPRERLASNSLEQQGMGSVPLSEGRSKHNSLGLSTSLSGLLGSALETLDNPNSSRMRDVDEDAGLDDHGRRAKRRLSNRDSARRTRQRKIEETRDLQTQVDLLKGDNIRLSQQVADLTKANEALVSSIPMIGEQNRETAAENRRLREENVRLRCHHAKAPSSTSCSSEQQQQISPSSCS